MPCAVGDEAYESGRQDGFAQKVQLLHNDSTTETQRYSRVKRNVCHNIFVNETRPADRLSDGDDKFHGRCIECLWVGVRRAAAAAEAAQ